MNFKKSFESLRKLESVITKDHRHRYNISVLRIGSFLKLNGEICLIQNIFTYKEGGDKWYELELLSITSGLTIYIEYEIDDKVDIYLTIGSYKIRDLPVSADDIEEMSEEENGEIRFQGQTFYYEDDYQASFSRSGSDKTEKVYLYEFSNEAGDRFLTIEEWKSEDGSYDYSVFISKEVDESAIEVLSV